MFSEKVEKLQEVLDRNTQQKTKNIEDLELIEKSYVLMENQMNVLKEENERLGRNAQDLKSSLQWSEEENFSFRIALR